MKIIEAMKKCKDMMRKAEDYRSKIALNAAHLSFETPTYGEKQREQIAEWVQGHEGLMQEILKLRVAIQRTNLATDVPIEINGKTVIKTIAEWIHRRRDLAKLDQQAWAALSDRNLQEGKAKNSQGGPDFDITVVRYYDPAQRDAKVELYRSEPMIIDGTLEVINAVTDLVE
jgi:hypothetical protein